jgi:hypothetical protein
VLLHIAVCRVIVLHIAGGDYRVHALKETSTLRSPHLLYLALGQGEAGLEAADRAALRDDPLVDCASHSRKTDRLEPRGFTPTSKA